MEDMPLISVIVPVYNVGEFLVPCLKCLMAQSYRNLEVLLIDDGSTDGSGKHCDEYAAKDSRFHVVHKENGGVSSARNLGLELAQGEYIAFVDADDCTSPDYLEVLYQDITQQQADIVCCNFSVVDAQYNHLRSHPRDAEGKYPNVKANRLIRDTETIFKDILEKKEIYWSHVHAGLIVAPLAKSCRFKGLKHYEDGLYFFELFCQSPVVYLDVFAGYLYAERTTSVSRTVSKHTLRPKTDYIRLCAHRNQLMQDFFPESAFCDRFFQEYVTSLHSMAFSASQKENKKARKESHQLILEHLTKIAPRRDQIPKRTRRRFALYAKSPSLYSALARLKEKIRG